MESPEYVRISLAAAMVLGARPGRFFRDVRLHCINLLLTYADGCHANCAYCGLARERFGGYEEKSFIRVDWPTLRTSEIVERMVKYSSEVSRVCVSMVTHQQAYRDTLEIVAAIHRRVDAPISALVAPNLLDQRKLEEFKQSGVDTIGVGLDACAEAVFERTRGRRIRGPLSWNQYWQVMDRAREIFGPNKVNAHLVIGIGETDRDFVAVVSRLQGMEVNAYLFSFYPEADSMMARRKRPSLRRYRRVQLVKYLVEKGVLRTDDIVYDDGGYFRQLDVSSTLVEEAIRSGEPFLTDGCHGKDGELSCTRPFGSYRPGEPFREFPFHPTEDDLVQVERQLRWRELVGAS